MKKRILSNLGIIVLMVSCLCVGAMAAGGLEQIQAYLNRDITIKLDGQTQTMYDAKGNRVYPISYNGTTYVPIRAVSNMLDIDVEWDGANKAVLLGKTGTVKDFIEEFKPYAAKKAYHFTSKDGKTKEIAGKTYDHYITGYDAGYTGKAYYDLGGKYTTLSFQAYAASDYYESTTLFFYGDNDELIKKVTLTPMALPQTYTVDVSGVQQLTIELYTKLYIFDATIE